MTTTLGFQFLGTNMYATLDENQAVWSVGETKRATYYGYRFFATPRQALASATGPVLCCFAVEDTTRDTLEH